MLWIGIHIVQLPLILLAVAVYWLTVGLPRTAAHVSRVALLPYLVFYSAFDSIVGLSRELVAHYGSELSSAQQAVLAGAIDGLAISLRHPAPFTIMLIGSLFWAVAAVAAAVALRQAGAPWTATTPLASAGVIDAIGDAVPYGPIAMALFLIAAAVLSRPRKPPVLQVRSA